MTSGSLRRIQGLLRVRVADEGYASFYLDFCDFPQHFPALPDHYASITVRSPRPRAYPNRITLVDDVITRGSSFVGMVPRLQEAFPDATVRCFTLVRTISTGDVDAIFAPTAGTITYRDGLLMRQP